MALFAVACDLGTFSAARHPRVLELARPGVAALSRRARRAWLQLTVVTARARLPRDALALFPFLDEAVAARWRVELEELAGIDVLVDLGGMNLCEK